MKIAIFSLAAIALLFPLQAAAASWWATSGPSVVTCWRGVQVYRHITKSAVPSTSVVPHKQSEKSAVLRQQAMVNSQLEFRKLALEERKQLAAENESTTRGARRYLGSRYSTYSGYGRRSFGYSSDRVKIRAASARRYAKR